MNTPAHCLLAAAASARPGDAPRNWAMFLGAMLPDAMLFVMVFWESAFNGLSEAQIFGQAYFSAFWQRIFAIGNSIPLYVALLALGLWARRELAAVVALCALLHVLLDFPLHHDDGHSHFWPFTDWKFESPPSYWDPAHHAEVVAPVEASLSVLLAVLLWRRFRGILARALILTTLAAELLFSLGGRLLYG